jgi:hypothetical protein
MAIGIKATKTTSYTAGLRSFSIPTSSVTADSEVALETNVDAGATNFMRALTVNFTQIVSMGIHSTKAVTIKTNSSSAPDQTFTLIAGQGIVWDTTDLSVTACPITTNLTKVYITNNDSTDSDVLMYFLINQPGVGS